jgi:glycosyltransferase 2 family protein
VLSLLALCTSLTIGRGIVENEFVFALIILIVGFISAWILGPTLLKRIPYLRNSKLAGKLNNVAEMVPRKNRVLVLITAISVIFHSLQISMHALMAYGVGASIPWGTLFVVIPFVNIASSLPISWNGLGVREKSYEFFLTPLLLLSREQALAFGGVWLLAVTVCSAVGGIVALVSGDLKLLKVNPKMVTSANDDLPSASKRVSGEHS